MKVLVQSENTTGLSLSIIYRPPPNKRNGYTFAKFVEEFTPFLDDIALGKNRVMLCGDFNLHMDNVSDKKSVEFKELVEPYGLKQFVDQPTHRRNHILDLIFTRDGDNLILDLTVKNNFISDHFWIICSLMVARPIQLPKIVKFRKIKEIDPDLFKADILSSKIGNPTSDDLSQLTSDYSTVLTSILDKHAPEKEKKVILRPNAPWYTDKIKSEKRDCRAKERKWRTSKLTIDEEIFRKQQDHVASEIEKAKQEYYSDKINDSDKNMYQVANKLLNKSKSVSLPLYKSPKDIANRFNNFFVKKIMDIRNDLQVVRSNFQHTSTKGSPQPPLEVNKTVQPTLSEFRPTTQEELKKVIGKSKTTHCSLDPIPTGLLKICLEVLLPIITKIVNLSLCQGIMPGSMKTALVIPLLKKVNLILEVLKNYRPVSNLSFVSKIIERIVANRLTEFMTKHDLHESLQSSYKKFHSCETALVKVQNDVLKAIDSGKVVLLVLLDLSAAFDTVDHDTLIELLAKRIGITGTALEWFKSYLNERIQSVTIDGVDSDLWNILFGVPQGSVLGPILFTIYTSPLGDILRTHNIDFHFYADDTQLYIKFNVKDGDDAFRKMEECIAEVRAWMANHFLKLNDNKTEVLIIGSRSNIAKLNDSSLTIGKEHIKPSDSARNIGAWFDKEMSMNEHVSHICKGAWFQLNQIAQIRQYLDNATSAKLIHSFVTSRLDSFNSLLYGIPKYQTDKLQRIQNSAARIIAKKKKYDHITSTLIDLHWLPIAERIEYKILLLTFKTKFLKDNKMPVYLKDLIDKYKCPQNTRLSKDEFLLVVPKTKMPTVGDRAFSYAAPRLWNSLPYDIRAIDSLQSFKSRLKTYLFKRAYGNELENVESRGHTTGCSR